LTDDFSWTNKQRIHQYRIDQKEKWGTKGPYKIDSDIVDSTIVPSTGTKYFDYLPQYLSTVTLGTGTDPVLWSQLTGIENGTFVKGGFQRGTAVGFALQVLVDSEVGYTTSYILSPTGQQTKPAHLPGPEVPNSWGQLNGINNLGQTVGQYMGFYDNTVTNKSDCPLGEGCGIYYKSPNKKPIYLSYPSTSDLSWTDLISINDAGWIVGSYWNYDSSDQSTHCVLYKPDAEGNYSNPIPFDPPGGGGGQCGGINGMGQIVGFGADGAAFVDDAEGGDPANPQNFQTLPSPPSSSAFDSFVPNGINNNGLVPSCIS
jgi:hypothetical protein